MKLWNHIGRQNSITGALAVDIPEHAVISFTGAGGKTSLIFAWADELAADGRKVAVTTTTHMYMPDQSRMNVIIENGNTDYSELCSLIDEGLERRGIIFVGAADPANARKSSSPSDDILDYVFRTADVTLVEADGSRRRPFKWPAPWEPAVPDDTDITVCVAGLSALGGNPDEEMYGAEFLPEGFRAGAACGIVDEKFMCNVLSYIDGGQKGAAGEFRIFLNQADSMELQGKASLMQKLLAVRGIQSAWGSLARPLNLAIILEAAGNSTRFGSNKLLYELEDGKPMVQHILDTVRILSEEIRNSYGGLVSVSRILVTQYEEVAALADDFTIVMNDQPGLGISRSMQLGIKAAGSADAYLFCVCDQPHLMSETLIRMIEAYREADCSGIAPIISLSWNGGMYNPKIFSSHYRDELMRLEGDTGGRQIINLHRESLCPVEASAEEEIRDIDNKL